MYFIINNIKLQAQYWNKLCLTWISVSTFEIPNGHIYTSTIFSIWINCFLFLWQTTWKKQLKGETYLGACFSGQFFMIGKTQWITSSTSISSWMKVPRWKWIYPTGIPHVLMPSKSRPPSVYPRNLIYLPFPGKCMYLFLDPHSFLASLGLITVTRYRQK